MRVECYVQESYVQSGKNKLLLKGLKHEMWMDESG